MRGLQAQNMKLASSELHQRLEHLITYSTQMIFVSGDGVGRKFQLVENFIAELSSDTNIAYFPASDNYAISDYRHKILSQLSSDALFDTNRPLAESFSRSMSHTSGSMLICIANADLLPKPFLKELWDLVLQNRFARDRFHLNILLFADEQWATQAKSWLPSQHQEQPVLVSASSQQQQQPEFSGSELDQMIAEKRQAFAKRIEQRQQSNSQQRAVPVIQTWWMKLLLACVFVLSFGSILLWQHYDVTKGALSEFASFLFQSEVAEQTSPDKPKPEVAATELVTAPNDVEQEAAELSITSQPESNNEIVDEQTGGELLVTDWQSAVKSLDDKLVTVSSGSTEAESEPQAEQSSDIVEIVSETPETEAQVTATEDDLAVVDMTEISTDEVEDYPVEDITSEPQITEPLYAYQEAELLKLADNHYVLQFIGYEQC